jgi:hypothetical protein
MLRDGNTESKKDEEEDNAIDKGIMAIATHCHEKKAPVTMFREGISAITVP